jgi:O-antigen/teichoic acid export membrane protein
LRLGLIKTISRAAGEERVLLSSTFRSLVVRLAGMVFSFILGVQLARRLNPDGFGTYGIVIALALVLSVLAQFGLPTVATRQISVALAQRRWGALRGYVRAFAKVVLAVSIALGALWAGVAFGFPRLLGSQSANSLGALLVPLFALTVLISAELRALNRIVAGQALEILVRPALMCGVLLFVYSFAGKLTAPVAVGVNVAASTVTLLLGLLWLRSATPAAARTAAALRPRAWIGPALALAAVDLLRQFDATYGILLLGAFSREAEAGYFRVAWSTIVFVATPLSIFNVVLAPELARLHSDGDMHRLQRIMSISAVAMFATTLAALVLIAVAGKPLIILIFGASYAPALLPLLLLTCAQAINGFFGVGWVLLSMSGGERMLTVSYATSVAVSVALAIPLTIIAGAPGAAAAAVVGALIQNLIAWRGVRLHSSLESSAVGFLWRARTTTIQEPS